MLTLFDNLDSPIRVTTPPAFRAAASSVKVTQAYETWWWFAAERQRIYYSRLRGEPAPWTKDQTLASYRFTNAYRAADRVSQYLIKDVIYGDDLSGDPDEVVFRILLFKIFNRVETWQALASGLGTVALVDNPFPRIDEILTGELDSGRQVYSAAYVMPTARSGNGAERKHSAHLELLQKMMADRLGERLAEAKTMASAFEMLVSYPMVGAFLAYQYVTDINYSPILDFSEREFVAVGPGAREGLRKCFLDTGGRTDDDLIRMMMDLQDEEFERLGLDFHDLFGRSLQLIDCQNIFCEVAKYARARFPELTPVGGRAKIKQRYWHAGAIPAPYFPPKWGINDTVDALFPSHPSSLDSADSDFAMYQQHAKATRFHEPVHGGDAITTPMLGLIGETGEVVSELKKRAREGEAYVAFRDRLAEEAGDLLWYVADLANWRGIRLADIDRNAVPVIGDVKNDGEGGWIRAALSLSEEAGRISHAYQGLLDGRQSDAQFDAILGDSLVALLTEIKVLMGTYDLSIGTVAARNLEKTRHRWVGPAKRVPAPSKRLWSEDERLPLCFDATLTDRGGRVRISFVIDGKATPLMADSLTDNAYDPDGYRFHDVFHMAYAAVLGWSPVTRSLLRRKRKSDPRVDEVEDGGRAVAIEEGISAMVFAYASQHRMLDGVSTIEDSVLRTIRDMTGHLEVSVRSEAEWQDAILQGFAAWRRIRDDGGGCVRVDKAARCISVIVDAGPDPKDLT